MTDALITQARDSTTPAGANAGRKGRGRARSGSNRLGNDDKTAGASGRGKGRAGRQRREHDRHPEDAVINPPSDADAVVSKGNHRHPVAEEDEGEVCFICASPIVHHAVSPCNHRTCHICSLRLRALYKSTSCAHCRTPSDFVIFTDDPRKRYGDFSGTEMASTDSNLGIKYEKAEICDDTILLLRYNCPDAACATACLGWPDLHRHVKSVHRRAMCDLCTRHKKVFTHEHQLFTNQQLRGHERFGDDNPGTEDQSGFKGHPECGFCATRFYGDDELYVHCRERHEKCHLCDRRNQGRQPQYYMNYETLEVHFRKAHFACSDQDCLDKKFVVFESEMDLKAHQLEVHPDGLSKDARRDTRRVDMSDFNLRGFHRLSARPNCGRRRGGDPESEDIPVSSAQPLRRDQLAYQRQLALHSDRQPTPRTFGGQLTQNTRTDTGARSAVGFASQSPSRANDTSNRAPPTGDVPLTTREQTRRLRHNTVTERASNMLKNDQAKVTEFRQKVSLYSNGSLEAAQLIDKFFVLFNTTSAELGTLFKELADVFEDVSKRDSLLTAWNDCRAINQDYPCLPGPSGVPASSEAAALGAGSSRVLKLKSSTARSSHSAVGQKASWGTASSSLFPPLPVPSTASTDHQTATGKGSVNPASSTASAPRISTRPSRPNSQMNLASDLSGASANAFPALPTARKPLLPSGHNGRAVRNPIGSRVAANVWATDETGATVSARLAETTSEPEGAILNRERPRGNRKNRKRTLLYFG